MSGRSQYLLYHYEGVSSDCRYCYSHHQKMRSPKESNIINDGGDQNSFFAGFHHCRFRYHQIPYLFQKSLKCSPSQACHYSIIITTKVASVICIEILTTIEFYILNKKINYDAYLCCAIPNKYTVKKSRILSRLPQRRISNM